MDGRDDQPVEGMQDIPGVERGAGAAPRSEAPRAERKRRKVSLIGAIVVNVVTLITLAIILLAVLLPGYRRSFTVARAVEGAEEVLILVRTSESMMRKNSTDFIKAQDGLKNALQEETGGGANVSAYVRDNFPDQAWVKENLPENMQEWLEELYPKPEVTEESMPGKASPNGDEQTPEGAGP